LVCRSLLALLLAFSIAESATAVTFADGLVHVLDASNSFPFEEVVVDDGPGGEVTTVNVLEGARVGAPGMRVLGHSVVNISGGFVEGAAFTAGLLATDAARVRISGGVVGSQGVDLRGSATLDLSGGFLEALSVGQEAQLRMTGGEILRKARISGGPSQVTGGFLHGGLVALEDTDLVLSGGVVDGWIETLDAAKISIGGSSRQGDTFFVGVTVIGNLIVRNEARVSITGGSLRGDIEVDQRGEVAISGGGLNGRLDVGGEGIVTFMGRDFAVTQNFHPVDVSGGEILVGFGSLTGQLANSNLHWTLSLMLFSKESRARILLERAPLVVDVEVRPRRKKPQIDPFSRRVVSVAILGSTFYDIETIDPDSLRFGPGGAPTLGRQGGRLVDVNGDGFEDLVSRYRIRQTGIAVGDTEACVVGSTLEGEPFNGCGAIETVLPRAFRSICKQPRH
jgi:hypothetical protein